MDEFDDQYIETLYAAPRGAPLLVLRHQLGSLAGTFHSFRTGRIHLGRRRDCEVHFDSHLDRMVSARHACIEEADGRWILEDLGSTNGTFVNGREIHARIALAHGDQVVLGSDDTEGSVGFSVELTEETAPRESETRTATPSRERADQAPRQQRTPQSSRGGSERGDAPPAMSPSDTSIEIGGPIPDSAEAAALRGELRALELTVPATRAAAEMAARALAEAAWNRGGVDWSTCPSIAAVLESERLSREADADATQFAAEHQRERSFAAERIASARARANSAQEKRAELESRLAEAVDRIAAENTKLASHCEPLFAHLDELSLVLSEIVAKHRPEIDDDILSDLAELEARMKPAIESLSDPKAELGDALTHRREESTRVAELRDEITRHDSECEAANTESERIEAEERHAETERAQREELVQRAARERAAELAARFAALGAEAARLKLPGIVDSREYGSASAALASLDAVEKRIAELRTLLSGSRSDGSGPGERPRENS